MLAYLKFNIQFVTLILIWVVGAFFIGTPAGVIVLLSAILLLRREDIAETFIGFIVILVISDSLMPSMAFAKSFKNVYILLLAFYYLQHSSRYDYRVRMYLYFLPFIFFAVVGMMFSPVLSTSVQKTLSYFLLLLIVPNYVVIAYQQNGAQFFRDLVMAIFFICFAGLVFKYINPEVAISHGGRFRGVFGNPNGLGIFLVMFTLLFTIIRTHFTELFSRWEAIIIYLFIFYFIIISGSRTALLSFSLFFIFSYFFRISVMLGFIFFGIVLLLTEYISNNFVTIINSFGLSEELRVETLKEGSGRLIAWDFAWREIQRSLFIGRGMGYDEYYMRSNLQTLLELGHEGGVHNTYLILWLNTGLFGLISFFSGFITVFVRASRRNKLSFPVMLTVMFSIIFEPWLAASLNPYTILFLISLTLLIEDIFYQESETEEESLT